MHEEIGGYLGNLNTYSTLLLLAVSLLPLIALFLLTHQLRFKTKRAAFLSTAPSSDISLLEAS